MSTAQIVTTVATTKTAVLTFGATPGVSKGMLVVNTAGVPNGSKVRSVTSTTVTLYENVTVASGAIVTFQSVDFHPESLLTDLD